MSESFCLMPPLNFPARRSAEAVHVEHAQVLLAAVEDRLRINAAQIAAVADVFRQR